MKYRVAISALAIAALSGFLHASDAKRSSNPLTAAEIADRNFSARGGVKAWRAVQTLTESGRLTAGGDRRGSDPVTPDVKRGANMKSLATAPRLKAEAQLPFVLKMERPRKTRYEIHFNSKTAVQVYNGAQGWKLRPFLNRLQVEPFTAEELKAASLQSELDGPLMNYAEKGTSIQLEGQESVAGRNTYKLKLTSRDNHVTHVWIDAETFLETKIEGQPRQLDGKEHPVEIYFADYRDVSGLKLPFVLETHVLPISVAPGAKRVPQAYTPEKIFIDNVTVNPKLSSTDFEKPTVQMAEVHP